MSNKKQPIEGLTIRLWDPPSEDNDSSQDKSSKGSRGFRQYTEQVGSEKLKYSTHDWKDKPKQELKKSTRDWDAEKKKLESVQDLPLVSRTDNATDTQSLRNVRLQHELWDLIMKKIREINDPNNKKEWDNIVGLFRKLREGVYATNWSYGNYTFAIKVFENSIDSSIKAKNFSELSKSLSGLINDLYTFKKDAEKPYYLLLYLLYHCCFVQNSTKAMETLLKLDRNTNEGIFGKQLTKCIFVTENPINFFKLYYNNPYPTFRAMMDNYTDAMRLKAIHVLRKSYLSASIDWVGTWLGVKNDKQMVVSIIEALVQPSCIKSIDHDFQLIYFLKKKK